MAREVPEIAVRLQEMFGVTRHPTVGPHAAPGDPAQPRPAARCRPRPTCRPSGQSSYADVRKDMRGRYPKHPWPEDPTTATPTLRAKPRGT